MDKEINKTIRETLELEPLIEDIERMEQKMLWTC